jgi:ATP/maltotriose-dependent transcriptional regulator MalT
LLGIVAATSNDGRGADASGRGRDRASHWTSMTSARDHELQAFAAYLRGEDEATEQELELAHRAAVDEGDLTTAVHSTFWLGITLLLRGQAAQGGAWLARGNRLAAQVDDCPTAGYLLVPQFLRALHEGDHDAALDLARRTADLGRRHRDADLQAFGTLGSAQALLAKGEIAAGTALLDEVMLAVTAGEVGAVTSGIVYCAVILACMSIYDLSRAAEWTAALTQWCDAQPDLVAYRGQCLVHRSQLQQAAGEWAEAAATAAAARRRLAQPPHPALGLAHYQDGELHRLVGHREPAEAAYRAASRHGRDPMPGLALLRRDEGDLDGAAAGIRRALQERTDRSERPTLLAAAVEVFRAAGDGDAARRAATELDELAAHSPAATLRAMADHAGGCVLVDDGDVGAGLDRLRDAARAWKAARMPYEGARTALELARGCVALGDGAAADLELENAREAFSALGAAPDLARLEARRVEVGRGARSDAGGTPASGLTTREREVLGLVAAGHSNREIAATLVLSEHTVRRHIEHIFGKLGVGSRAAATAHAFEHGLLDDR